MKKEDLYGENHQMKGSFDDFHHRGPPTHGVAEMSVCLPEPREYRVPGNCTGSPTLLLGRCWSDADALCRAESVIQ